MTKIVLIERRSLRSPITRHRKGMFLVTDAIANLAGRWLRFDRYSTHRNPLVERCTERWVAPVETITKRSQYAAHEERV